MAPAAPARPPSRVIRCPGCGGPSVYGPENEHRPFCSGRCRNHDLGAWASEGYAVVADPTLDSPDLPDPGAPDTDLPRPH